MEFKRQDRMRSILIELVSQFIREEANTEPLITVTDLTLSANSAEATVFFTTVPNEGENDALVFLKRKGTELRKYVKQHGRLKFLPHFNFEIDFGERNRQHIDELVKGAKEKKR